MKEIKLSECTESIFELISKDWGVLTVQTNDKVNGMTVSWVQMGHLWNKNVISVYVRPQRYTYAFINEASTFSLAFFDESYRTMLSYLGTESGLNEDKLHICGFTTHCENETPVIDQAKLVFVCKKIAVHDLREEEMDQDIVDGCYPNKDFHRVYIGEIIKVLKK